MSVLALSGHAWVQCTCLLLTQSGHSSKDVVSNPSAALAPLRSIFNQNDGALRAISVQVRACSAARVDNVFRAVPANRRKLRLSVP